MRLLRIVERFRARRAEELRAAQTVEPARLDAVDPCRAAPYRAAVERRRRPRG